MPSVYKCKKTGETKKYYYYKKTEQGRYKKRGHYKINGAISRSAIIDELKKVDKKHYNIIHTFIKSKQKQEEELKEKIIESVSSDSDKNEASTI